MKIRLFTKNDIKQILTMKDALELVEKAFGEKGLGRVQMPPKPYLYFKRYSGDLRIMPAYLEGFGAGVKIVNVHPNNPEKYGLPTVLATILLVDPKTGAPICIMDGTQITDFRTGAGGAVAAKYLARKDSRMVGMIGAGAQARTQLQALSKVLELESCKVADSIHGRPVRAKPFAEEMSKQLGIDVKLTGIEQAVRDADIVVTVTPVRSPIIRDEWVREGTHINAIGADAPGKQELDLAILKRAKVVVDDLKQASHGGEINVPLAQGLISKDDIHAEIGEVVVGKKPGRVSAEELTVFDSTGLAIQDVATAQHVYEKGKKLGLGTEVELF